MSKWGLRIGPFSYKKGFIATTKICANYLWTDFRYLPNQAKYEEEIHTGIILSRGGESLTEN